MPHSDWPISGVQHNFNGSTFEYNDKNERVQAKYD